uniref:Uncharacterized protein n=1 Tax=Amphimedon queenslandica TaxID=400682 RepID=A0A1X7VGG3_AMPQE
KNHHKIICHSWYAILHYEA